MKPVTKPSVRTLILVPLMTALTAAGAFIRIPMPLAPITMMNFFTLMSGVLLGKTWGTVSQLLYLALGLFGLPIFAQGGGFTYVLLPSFGFLLGLIPGAWVAGYVYEKKPTYKGLILAGVLSMLAIYVIGLPYMYLILRFYLQSAQGIGYVMVYGCLIFLPGDALKVLLCTLITPRLKRALNAPRA